MLLYSPPISNFTIGEYCKYPMLTKWELEIIKLIVADLSTEQISEKLSLSHYTVNLHHGNILKKNNKSHISNLIYDLKERGLL